MVKGKMWLNIILDTQPIENNFKQFENMEITWRMLDFIASKDFLPQPAR